MHELLTLDTHTGSRLAGDWCAAPFGEGCSLMFRTLWLATEWRAEAAHADTLSSPRWRFLGSRPGRRNPRGTVTNLPPKAPNTHTPTRGETPRGPVRRSPDRLPSEGTDKRPQKSAPLSLSYHGIIRPSAAMRRPAPTNTSPYADRPTAH